MVTIKSPREIETMAAAGRIVGGTLALIRREVKPGMSTEDLDALAEEFIRSHPGARPSFKGLYGFPKTLCTSINEEIVHGIPSAKRVLHEGSIVSVDVGVLLDGLHADSATTVAVGEIAPETQRLLDVTQESLVAGMAQARAGNHVGDIGHAVQTVAEGGGTQAGPKAARRHDDRNRADDHPGQSRHQDPGRQVDRGHCGRKFVGPFRAYGSDLRRRAEDSDVGGRGRRA